MTYLFGNLSFEAAEKRQTLKALSLSTDEISTGIDAAWHTIGVSLGVNGAEITPEIPPLNGGGVGNVENLQQINVENFNEETEQIPLKIYEEVFAQFFNGENPEVETENEPPQRITPAVRKVLDYLTLHPEDAELNDSALAKKVGVSHPTVGKARKV